MLISYLKALVRLFAAVYAVKKQTRVTTLKTPVKYEPYRFGLDEMRCPICGRRPHKGLTAQLSARARSEGMMGCPMHGPVKAEILLSLHTSGEQQAA